MGNRSATPSSKIPEVQIHQILERFHIPSEDYNKWVYQYRKNPLLTTKQLEDNFNRRKILGRDRLASELIRREIYHMTRWLRYYDSDPIETLTKFGLRFPTRLSMDQTCIFESFSQPTSKVPTVSIV